MIPDSVRRLITSRNALHDLDKDSPIFWVDHRALDDETVAECAEVWQSPDLAPEWVGEDLYVKFGGNRVRVPLTESADDRHITLLAINEAIAAKGEVRLIWDSEGSDTLALAVLSNEEWAALEQEYGAEAVNHAFMRLKQRPNIFTDSLKRPRASRSWWSKLFQFSIFNFQFRCIQ